MRKSELIKAVEQLKHTAEMQALIIDDITTAQRADGTTYRGNAYTSYKSAVTELAKKYEGTADWGVIQTGSIIDVRAAFIIGQGVNIIPVNSQEEAKAELDFIKRFFSFNDIDREMAQEFAKEAELEGRFLGQLFWDEEESLPSIRFRSWTQNNYRVVTDPNDYSWFTEVNWHEEGGAEKKLKEAEFIYARFAGRVHQPELPYPKVAKCLGQIERLDKALRDWSEITRLFAAPIPHVECETPEQAKFMADNIGDVAKNWKIKKLFAHTGKLSYTSPDSSGIEYLEKLIISLAKMISGTTGVPIGLMGLGDLTTKLGSSSEVTADQLSSSTSKEREIWVGTYEQLISKAMAMYNGKSGKTPLRPDVVQVKIPFVTTETWKRIADIWMPLYMAGGISLKTMLSKVPDVNIEEEIAELEDVEAKRKLEDGDDDDTRRRDDE